MRQLSFFQLWGGQSKAPIDLEVDAHRAEHISAPVFTCHGISLRHEPQIDNAVVLIDVKLFLKMVVMVLLLGQDGDPGRIAALSCAASVVFLYQTGILALLLEVI